VLPVLPPVLPVLYLPFLSPDLQTVVLVAGYSFNDNDDTGDRRLGLGTTGTHPDPC
jgi:hypothetical protein